MAAHLFLPLAGPVLPGAFSALRFAAGILGFSTQQPALFGENAVENV